MHNIPKYIVNISTKAMKNYWCWINSTRTLLSIGFNTKSHIQNALLTLLLVVVMILLNHHHHHHHLVRLARISLTLSRHFSLSIIASGRSSGLYPVSSHSCCMYVRAGGPAFAQPYVGVHRSTSLMSSLKKKQSLLNLKIPRKYKPLFYLYRNHKMLLVCSQNSAGDAFWQDTDGEDFLLRNYTNANRLCVILSQRSLVLPQFKFGWFFYSPESCHSTWDYRSLFYKRTIHVTPSLSLSSSF